MKLISQMEFNRMDFIDASHVRILYALICSFSEYDYSECAIVVVLTHLIKLHRYNREARSDLNQ